MFLSISLFTLRKGYFLSVGLSTLHFLASLLNLLEDCFVFEGVLGYDLGGLCLEGNVV